MFNSTTMKALDLARSQRDTWDVLSVRRAKNQEEFERASLMYRKWDAVVLCLRGMPKRSGDDTSYTEVANALILHAKSKSFFRF